MGGQGLFQLTTLRSRSSVIKVKAENADRNPETGTEAEDGVQGMCGGGSGNAAYWLA